MYKSPVNRYFVSYVLHLLGEIRMIRINLVVIYPKNVFKQLLNIFMFNLFKHSTEEVYIQTNTHLKLTHLFGIVNFDSNIPIDKKCKDFSSFSHYFLVP